MMAAQKRKSEISSERRPEKKQKATKSSTEQPKHTTVLRDEEVAFPRGGSSVLTPLERRQIQIQAKQDVLFEQSTGKKKKTDFESEDEVDDDLPEEPAVDLAVGKKPKKSHKFLEKGKKNRLGQSDTDVRIESLGYKRLVRGSLVLGYISAINRYDVTVSLPNNLTGYVPVTSISEKVTQAIEELAAENNSETDDGDHEEPAEFQLHDYVRIGQYVRVYVSSVGSQEQDGQKQGNKRRITLSLVPDQVNSGMSEADLVVDNVVQACVESVEDHGVVMNLGIDNSHVKAFMGSKELPAAIKLSDLKPGAVMLCLITGLSSNGKVIKLSADEQKIGNLRKSGCLTDAPSINSFQPGCAVEVLISSVESSGIVGKIMGLLDVTADVVHSGAKTNKSSLEKRFPIGSKVKARVICNFPTSDTKKLAVSFLPHLLTFSPRKAPSSKKVPTDILAISSTIKEAKVLAVETGVGIFMDVGAEGIEAFAHISKLSDEKVTSISADSGPYKIGTVHSARVTGYNAMDGLFILSLERSVIDMPYLRLEDISLGEIVKGTVEKLIASSSQGHSIIVRLTHHIDGLVPEVHMSDVQLQTPEKKFRGGLKVTARVLSLDLERRRMRLTLKKSLVNSEAPVWSSYSNLSIGSQAPGTVVSIMQAGAVVQFYGDVKGFLPVSQMSETFIKDPRQHFRVGQVVNTHILSIEPAEKRMSLSCRDVSSFGPQQQKAYEELSIGSLISGVVSEKTQDEIVVEIGDAKIKATLHIDHLADGSAQKCLNAAKRIRVSQMLSDLLIIQKFDSKHLIQVSSKPALIKAEKSGRFPCSFSALTPGQEVVGFVRNITDNAVYVQFATGLTGLLPRKQMSDQSLQLPDFGLRRNATITCRVLSVDGTQERFVLTQKEVKDGDAQSKAIRGFPLIDPIDKTLSSSADMTFGKIMKAKITAVKDSQLNVSLAEGVQGRVDISQIFDHWDEIKDRKHPLNHFKANDVITVRIIGAHNHRNHKFLPISHVGRAHVLELTARKSDLEAENLQLLTIERVSKDQEYLCFVNNVAGDCLWVNITPNIRGRIRSIDASDDTSILSNLTETFPLGSAIRTRVLSVNTSNNHLDLTARTGTKEAPKTLADLSEGMVLPGKVTRVSERQIMIQLSDTLSGPVHLVEMADDFSTVNPASFEKNQIVRVHVTNIDIPNKKVVLSTRPSKVLSSSLPVVDKDIRNLKQLKVNDVVRGFVKNVADNGVFLALSGTVTAFVRISDLSDMFLKDWKSEFEIDRLVQGKVIAVDPASNHLQMSLKRSVVENESYKPPIKYQDLAVGQIVTGKVRKVEDFGVFLVVDNSTNVSGLCHRSEIADEKVTELKSLYAEGDIVKAKVLRVDINKRRVAFGLKASYFQRDEAMGIDESDAEQGSNSGESDLSDAMNGVTLANVETDVSSDGADENDSIADLSKIYETSDSDEDQTEFLTTGRKFNASNKKHTSLNGGQGLNVGKIDWTGFGDETTHTESESDVEAEEPRKRKRRKAQIQIDRTAELDSNGPQSSADFERLLMSEPNSSFLWLSYMAYHLKLNEIAKAREIAERAVNTVNHQSRETEEEAMNVWVGYLNLENTYGMDEAVTEVFNRATQYNDSEEIHSRLASIYIQSQKTEKADELLRSMIKRFSQTPKIWINYADFLFETAKEPVRGRDLLPRALQALAKHHHLDITTKFAQLEFKAANGDSERGRTMFEGLIDTYPKRLDLYNVLLDLEQKSGDVEQIRRHFQRITSRKLKPKQAKHFFKRWLEYEELHGDVKSANKVKARAEDYVRKQVTEG